MEPTLNLFSAANAAANATTVEPCEGCLVITARAISTCGDDVILDVPVLIQGAECEGVDVDAFHHPNHIYHIDHIDHVDHVVIKPTDQLEQSTTDSLEGSQQPDESPIDDDCDCVCPCEEYADTPNDKLPSSIKGLWRRLLPKNMEAFTRRSMLAALASYLPFFTTFNRPGSFQTRS